MSSSSPVANPFLQWLIRPTIVAGLTVSVASLVMLASCRAEAQSVVNSLGNPPPAKGGAPAEPVRTYDPFTPPAADEPVVVSASQDEIAAALAILPGETNEQYTERMKVRYDAAIKELKRVSAEHAIRMRALANPNRR
jgi:hypothetical protein